MSNPIYTSLCVNELKQLLTMVDDSENKTIVGVIIKCGAEWCRPCQEIKPYCYNIFKNYPEKVVCFDINIDSEENMELYLAYKQKKMIRNIPVIFAYILNPERDKNHWWAPDFSVNSGDKNELDIFFAKVKENTNKL